MKNWTPYLDLYVKSVTVVPTWIRFVGLPLKYWGQSSLNKLEGLVDKPITTNRATT